MQIRYARPSAAFLVALLIVASPQDIRAQHVRYSVVLGAGHTSWRGPYVEGGTVGPVLGAGAIEWRVATPIAVRAELGGGRYAADLGSTGSLSLPTKLSLYRVHIAALGTVYPLRNTGQPQFFVEFGAAGWRRTSCDVNMVGGPGFFGGETLGCGDWEPDATGVRPLRPTSSGASFLIGAGSYFGRLGLTLRYETGGTAFFETGEGAIRARTIVVAAEWVFKGTPETSLSAIK